MLAVTGGRPPAAGSDPLVPPPESPDASVPPPIPWNPLSYASARAAIVEAENALGAPLDELVVFVDPPADAATFAELTPRDIEGAVLSGVAGVAELLREAARRFMARGSGTVALVVAARPGRGPLSAMVAGALDGLSEGLAATGGGSSWRFVAIRDESDQPEPLARFVLRALDEPPREQGKVLRHTGRSGLFGRI